MAKRARRKPQSPKTTPKKGARRQKSAAKNSRSPRRMKVKRATVSRRRAKTKTRRADVDTLRTPPSSLDMARAATAARSGRRALDENRRRHSKMAALTAGDVDADMESAYFSGDETPGGDNPTPDQNDVDEIGHAVGVEYQDNEELKSADKIDERDKHRWDNE